MQMSLAFRTLIATVLILLIFCSETRAQGVLGNDELTAGMVEVLHNPRFVVVYNLEAKNAKAKEASFYGSHMLGKANLNDRREQVKLGQLLIDGISPKSVVFSPFRPRYGLSFLSFFHRIDLVVSSDCQQIEIYSPNGRFWNRGCLGGSNAQIEELICKALKVQDRAKLADSILEQSERRKGRFWRLLRSSV